MFPLPIFSVSLQHNFTISEQVFAEKENYSGDIFKGNAVNKQDISLKNAILDGCSTVDSKLDYDGIGWYSMVLHGTRWYFAIE